MATKVTRLNRAIDLRGAGNSLAGLRNVEQQVGVAARRADLAYHVV